LWELGLTGRVVLVLLLVVLVLVLVLALGPSRSGFGRDGGSTGLASSLSEEDEMTEALRLSSASVGGRHCSDDSVGVEGVDNVVDESVAVAAG
jgi:hypothetical protein